MTSSFGNYNLVPAIVPFYDVYQDVFHINESTTVEQITEYYNSHRRPGNSFGAMTAYQRLNFYRHHLPRMEYKGFTFYMDLARNGKPSDFLTVRQIKINNRGEIMLWKVASVAKAALVRREGGFDPDWARVPGGRTLDGVDTAAHESSGARMPQLHAADSGKTNFACRPDNLDIYIEYASGPTETLVLTKPPIEFNYLDFVFNTIDQIYTSQIVLS